MMQRISHRPRRSLSSYIVIRSLDESSQRRSSCRCQRDSWQDQQKYLKWLQRESKKEMLRGQNSEFHAGFQRGGGGRLSMTAGRVRQDRR